MHFFPNMLNMRPLFLMHGSFGINQIQTIQTATFGVFSFFLSGFDRRRSIPAPIAWDSIVRYKTERGALVA